MEYLNSGIFIDFNSKFIINVVDEKYSEYEIKALNTNKLSLYFVSKGIVSLFLVNVDDALETCDIPFSPFDFIENGLVDYLNNNNCYNVEIRYLNNLGTIIANKEITLNSSDSKIIKEELLNSLNKDFDEELFNISLEKIQNKYEPFELEEHAIVKSIF